MSKHIEPERSKTRHHLFRTNAAVELLWVVNVLWPNTGAKNDGTDTLPVTWAAMIGVPPALNAQVPFAYSTLPRATLPLLIVKPLPPTTFWPA